MPEDKRGSRPLASEDWLAVGLGFLIIILVLAGTKPDRPSFTWATDGEFAAAVASKKAATETLVKDAEAKGDARLAAAATALKTALDTGDRAAIAGAARKLEDAAKRASDAGLQKRAADLGRAVGRDAGAVAAKVFSGENIWRSVMIGLGYLVLAGIGIALMGGSLGKFLLGFPVIFALAWLSQVLAGNHTVNYWGLEYVIFALVIGLFISNVLGVPAWLREAVRTEFYIKRTSAQSGGHRQVLPERVDRRGGLPARRVVDRPQG
jgi:hypothetical protein